MLHDLKVNSAEFNREGTRMVTASDDGTARVWSIVHPKAGTPDAEVVAWAETVQSKSSVRDGGAVTQELPRRGTPFVQVEDEGSIGKLLRGDGSERSALRLKHRARINSAEFSRDGSRVVTTSQDKTAQVWNAESGEADGAPFIHAAEVSFARFSNDGRQLITAGADGSARVWDMQSRREKIPPLRHNASVSFADFSIDGRHLVTASEDKTARGWNAETGSPEGKPMVHEYEVVYAQFNPDARLLVTIAKHWFSPNSMAQVIRLWDAASGNPVSDPIPLSDDDERSDGPAFAKFSEDGRWLLITAGSKKIWFNLEIDQDGNPWLARFAEIAGGLELNKAGGIATSSLKPTVVETLKGELRKYSTILDESRPTHSRTTPERTGAPAPDTRKGPKDSGG